MGNPPRKIKTDLTDDALIANFGAELKALGEQGEIEVRMTPLDLWMVLCALQLALRHPKYPETSAKIVDGIARQIQDRVASTGALAEMARRGWLREYDEK